MFWGVPLKALKHTANFFVDTVKKGVNVAGIDKLQDIQARKALPKEVDYKLTDGGGLYLLVTAKGSKLWRFDYRFAGKRKTLALGVYPEVGLATARGHRKVARDQLKINIDPSEDRKEKKRTIYESAANTLKSVAEEWLLGNHAATVAATTAEKTGKLLKNDIFPALGHLDIAEIEGKLLLSVLRKIETRAPYTAHKALRVCSQIWRYGIATGRVERCVPTDLKGALKPFKVDHFPTITDPVALGRLLRSIDGYEGSFITRAALILGVMTFARPGELRAAKWADINLDEGLWCYRVTKTGVDQVVPLASQSVELLREVHKISGDFDYVFFWRS